MTTASDVRFDGITKRFPGVVALDNVSFAIASGSCHALCGENGAGKSTLGKLLAGIYTPDEGQIFIGSQPAKLASPTDALKSGVAMVHQELSFCENLSVAENLCLGSLPTRRGFVSRREMRRRAEAMLAPIGVSLDVRRSVGSLTIGQQQMLQIASAIGQGARLIVFDEPTSSLSQHEAERLYTIIGRLRERGVTCIYVSHRLEEIFLLCDTITVLRDGRHVATRSTAEVDRNALVEMMIGRSLGEYFPSHVHAASGAELLRVSNLSSPAGFKDISFSLRAGEVLGCAGLVGAGRSEVAAALFGLDPHSNGEVVGSGPARPVDKRCCGHRAWHRPRARGSQASGARLVDGRAQQRDAVDSAAPREAGIHHAGRRAGSREPVLRATARQDSTARYASGRTLGR